MTPPEKLPFQFGLGNLFVLTGAVAIAAAVAIRFVATSSIGRFMFVANIVEFVIIPGLFLVVLFLMHRGYKR